MATLRDNVEVLLDAACTNCKVRVNAIKKYRERGLQVAIDYIRSVPGYNATTLEMLNEIVRDKKR